MTNVWYQRIAQNNKQRLKCHVTSLHLPQSDTVLYGSTVCSGASSRCRTRQRDSSPALVDVTTILQCWGNSTGFRSDNESTSWCNGSVFCRWLSARLSRRPSPATIGRHRHVLCSTDQPWTSRRSSRRCFYERSIDQHTVRRPELCSRWTVTAALEQSAGQDSPARQWHWRISSTAKLKSFLFRWHRGA